MYKYPYNIFFNLQTFFSSRQSQVVKLVFNQATLAPPSSKSEQDNLSGLQESIMNVLSRLPERKLSNSSTNTTGSHIPISATNKAENEVRATVC
jgi:hypothetical protein